MAEIKLTFKPGVTTQVQIPDQNLLFHAEQHKTTAVPQPGPLINQALDNPISALRLTDSIKPTDKLVIIVDDFTRPTPAAVILPPILERIHQVGVSKDDVVILIATGTHRAMTDQELAAKLGKKVSQQYKVINHDYQAGPFVHIGDMDNGTPVEVNKLVVEADFKIGIGNVVPHTSAGWGGGAKIILPGVCSEKTTEMMHIRAVLNQPVLDVPGKLDIPTRHEMEEIATKVGLDFIVNTVLDDQGNILAAFSGHFIKAHKAACAFAEKTQIIPIPAQADILIVSANPCHYDFWQGLKPYVYSHQAVREDGVIIFLLDGTEGLCGDAPSHEPTFRKYLLWSFEDQKIALERGEVDDLVAIHAAIHHAQVRQRVKKTFCVTNHISPQDIRAMGFESAPSVQQALEWAYGLLGSDAKVGVIPYGGETLVAIQ
jgi:nickel-dependent lactate racemase